MARYNVTYWNKDNVRATVTLEAHNAVHLAQVIVDSIVDMKSNNSDNIVKVTVAQ